MDMKKDPVIVMLSDSPEAIVLNYLLSFQQPSGFLKNSQDNSYTILDK